MKTTVNSLLLELAASPCKDFTLKSVEKHDKCLKKNLVTMLKNGMKLAITENKFTFLK